MKKTHFTAYDDDDRIKECLVCEKAECNNCHQYKRGCTSGRAVEQYDTDLNLVARYANRKEAAKAIGGDVSSIGECIRGNRKTYRGYIWKNA